MARAEPNDPLASHLLRTQCTSMAGAHLHFARLYLDQRDASPGCLSGQSAWNYLFWQQTHRRTSAMHSREKGYHPQSVVLVPVLEAVLCSDSQSKLLVEYPVKQIQA